MVSFSVSFVICSVPSEAVSRMRLDYEHMYADVVDSLDEQTGEPVYFHLNILINCKKQVFFGKVKKQQHKNVFKTL